MGIIYKATNIKNNKVYIGQTIHTLEKRKRNHYASTSGCTYFSHALHYYDEKDWVWEIIDEAKTREELNEKERYWIKFYDSKNAEKGYNLTDGGQGSFGVFVSEDTKKRIRESLLKKTKNNYDRNSTQNTIPVKCIETNELFISCSKAAKAYGTTLKAIRDSMRNNNISAGGMHWTYLNDDEKLSIFPNAIYCKELDKIYYNIKEARKQDRFHEGNLSKIMNDGSPYDPKKYAGYTFYWVNPNLHDSGIR